jgi:uncharacterized protein (DUF1499 family)
MFKFAGTRPTNLGFKDGQLTPCPNTPNCVCSSNSDQEHGIAEISFSGRMDNAMEALKQVINRSERTQIVVQSHDYLHVEFTSKLMGFVDDVEFYIQQGRIQVRSASRLGKSDLGVNRARIEAIRTQLQEAGI